MNRLPLSQATRVILATHPLVMFRVGLALVLLVQAILMMSHVSQLFGSDALFSRVSYSPNDSQVLLSVDGLSRMLSAVGVAKSPTTATYQIYSLYILSLTGLVIGQCVRVCTILGCILHALLRESGIACEYGVDAYAQIGLFYCIWLPNFNHLQLQQASPQNPGQALLWTMRIHLALAYGFSGLEKAQGVSWWNGEAIWQAVMRGDSSHIVDLSWLAHVPWFVALVGWLTLVLEIGYPVCCFVPQTRRFWVVCTIGLHLGIALFMGLWTFSMVMIVFNAALFFIEWPKPPRLGRPTSDTIETG